MWKVDRKEIRFGRMEKGGEELQLRKEWRWVDGRNKSIWKEGKKGG